MVFNIHYKHVKCTGHAARHLLTTADIFTFGRVWCTFEALMRQLSKTNFNTPSH